MLVEVEKDSRLHTGFLVSCMVVAVMGRLNGIALFLVLCICHTLIIDYPSTHISYMQTLMSVHSLEGTDAQMDVLITQGAFAADVQRECTYQKRTPMSA